MKKRRHARGMVRSGLFKSNWPDLCLDLFKTPKSVSVHLWVSGIDHDKYCKFM